MINRVILIGRLTKDPELRRTPQGDDEQQLDELADKVEEEFEDDFDPMSI